MDTQLIIKSGETSINNKIEITHSVGLNNEYSGMIYFDKGRKLKDAKKEVDKITAKDFSSFLHEEWINKIATKLIYFPANLNYDIEVGIADTLTDKAIIDFSTEKVFLIWNLILDKIQKYQEQELQIRQEISKTVEQASNGY